jgi:hypothetical protein
MLAVHHTARNTAVSNPTSLRSCPSVFQRPNCEELVKARQLLRLGTPKQILPIFRMLQSDTPPRAWRRETADKRLIVPRSRRALTHAVKPPFLLARGRQRMGVGSIIAET